MRVVVLFCGFMCQNKAAQSPVLLITALVVKEKRAVNNSGYLVTLLETRDKVQTVTPAGRMHDYYPRRKSSI